MLIANMIENMAKDARHASRQLRKLGSAQKDDALEMIATKLIEKQEEIIRENQKDLLQGRKGGLPPAMIDRLTLDEKIIGEMAESLKEVASLPDPVGEVTGMWKRPNGLLVGRVRIPLGVIGFIYESRPNVTIDAAGLCLKSGNAVLLKGGSEAIHSNLILADLLEKALMDTGLPPKAAQVIPTTDREAVNILIGLDDYLDIIIPRGGEGLIRFVTNHSKVPVLKHYKGVCHIYVDKSADLATAKKVCFNAKVQRPGVCNAMETLLVHKSIAADFLPGMLEMLCDAGVEIRGCPETVKISPGTKPAIETDWPAEFLDLVLAVKVVSDMDEALDHIERYSSNHTDAIITNDY
ncbi:MAG TPA: glutamate-5-semialdehyde dehydrogenase, partial [Desulfobacteraceae bacterium]|nr:glutamate-5-semialdehyde dehydrogenase [Desulfobacteraceae bacterium]